MGFPMRLIIDDVTEEEQKKISDFIVKLTGKKSKIAAVYGTEVIER